MTLAMPSANYRSSYALGLLRPASNRCVQYRLRGKVEKMALTIVQKRAKRGELKARKTQWHLHLARYRTEIL